MDIARAGLESSVVKFYRQYMQQINELNYPPGTLLVNSDVQDCLYKYFFDASRNRFLPPPRYQARVLRRLIEDIEKSIKDPDEDAGWLWRPSLSFQIRVFCAVKIENFW